jgi:peroxiredoxin
MPTSRWIVLCVLTLSCAPTPRQEEVTPPAPPPKEVLRAAPPSEGSFMQLNQRASDLVAQGRQEEAKAVSKELQERYPVAPFKSPPPPSVLGRTVAPLDDVTWYQGSARWGASTATLVVFWEAWCPHCARALPRLEATWKAWQPRGLQVVALTPLSRGSTEEDVRSFILKHGLTFPIGKDGGGQAEVFGVNGVPAAAAVRDGVVVWRGHPAQVTDTMLAGWLAR